MKNFCRMTKLTNISGRADYISANRQENFVCGSEPIDWTPYAEFEKANKKSNLPNNEGRELIIALPNGWGKKGFFQSQASWEKSLKEKVQALAELAVGKKTDMQWSVHWNKNKTNLHVHIIFSERRKLEHEEFKVWQQAVYLKNDGSVARNKSDRATDADGNVLPPIYKTRKKKLDGFSPKDKIYKQAEWLQNVKDALAERFKELGVNVEPYDLLHEYHEGPSEKGKPNAKGVVYENVELEAIRAKNRLVRIINENFKKFEQTTMLTDAERNDHKSAALESLLNGQKHVFKLPEKKPDKIKPQLTPPKKQPKPKPAPPPKLSIPEKISKLKDLRHRLIKLQNSYMRKESESRTLNPFKVLSSANEQEKLQKEIEAVIKELGEHGIVSKKSGFVERIEDLTGREYKNGKPFNCTGLVQLEIKKLNAELPAPVVAPAPPPARRASPPQTVKPPKYTTKEQRKAMIDKMRKEQEATSPPKPTRRIKKSNDEIDL